MVPRDDQASFSDISDAALADTARMVRRLLAALRDLLGDIPYNYAIVSAPDGENRTACGSWHLDVLPRLATVGGFELATGIAVNPVPPEQAAARLRRAIARPIRVAETPPPKSAFPERPRLGRPTRPGWNVRRRRLPGPVTAAERQSGARNGADG